MELDVLEVQGGRAGALGHREAAADRVARVRRVEEEAADAAGREDREVREDRVDLALAVEHVRAEAGVLERVPLGDVPRLVARRDEVDRGRLREERDVLLAGEPGEEGRLDRPSRGVGRVDDARDRVRALAREVQLAARRARERDADRVEEDLLHDLRAAVGRGTPRPPAGTGPAPARRMSFTRERGESFLPK